MNKFHQDLIPALRQWLGADGLEFFGSVYAEHGNLCVVLPGKVYPHSIHFHEGMSVRNFIRGWYTDNNIEVPDCHFLDDNWADAVIECL